jgi:NADPH-dependent 2,4-dienoyl-CoA reductase/sulfur reductase-like enzyme
VPNPGRRILVVGGVAAGPSAAAKAARVDERADVVLFEQGEVISYAICELPYFVSNEVGEDSMVVYTAEKLASEKGVEVFTRHRVERINPGRRTLTVRDLGADRVREERYDRLVLATGSAPRSLALPGETAPNVFHVRRLEDALSIKRRIDTDGARTAVIIGGGLIGTEMADAFHRRGLAVTLVHNQRLPLSGFEERSREHALSLLKDHGVRFLGPARTLKIELGPDGRARGVLTDAGPVAAEIVIVAVGVEPRTTLARELGLRLGSSGAIVTDKRQAATIDGIYAAGDCCEVRDLVTGRPIYVPLATVASKTGWTAGENAAGGRAEFPGALDAVAVRVFSTEFMRAGLTSEGARQAGIMAEGVWISAASHVASMPGSTEVEIHLLGERRSRRLLGVNVVGQAGAVLRGNAIAAAIQQRIRVDELRHWDLAYAPPFTPLWDPIIVAANALSKKL